jgi:hypothetical protein
MGYTLTQYGSDVMEVLEVFTGRPLSPTDTFRAPAELELDYYEIKSIIIGALGEKLYGLLENMVSHGLLGYHED